MIMYAAKLKLKQKSINNKGLMSISKAVIALLLALISVSAATFAWYVYNTEAHTTKVRMAAGSSVFMQISTSYDGAYSSAVVMESFVGKLNPVSTDKITAGFQKVAGFVDGAAGQPLRIANLFKSAVPTDYYKTSLFIKSGGDKDLKLYISDIGFEDSDSTKPISSAIRMGFVVHNQGKDQPVAGEYIFAISDAKNPEREYNTASGSEGHVLDSSKTDGSTVAFAPYTSANYCVYNSGIGLATSKPGSVAIGQFKGDGTPVQVDVYIWLEGCDEDCTLSLASTTLKNVALSFAGIYED